MTDKNRIPSKKDGLISELQDYYRTPMWWWQQAKKNFFYPLHRSKSIFDETTYVMEEEWDTLIILDACRSDLFEEVEDIATYDSYSRVNSGASATKEWVRKQFPRGAYTSTIYITGNAVVSEYITSAFYRFSDAWRHAYDNEQRLIPAEPLVDEARDLREKYPEKRMIIHFAQPHYPFIHHPELQFYNTSKEGASNVWSALRKGIVDEDTVWNAYKDNLRYVLDIVLPFIDELRGTTVVTSDHGNLLGERIYPVPLRQWGHPPGLRHSSLTQVPWAVVEHGDTDVADQSGDVEEQLQALGYK